MIESTAEAPNAILATMRVVGFYSIFFQNAQNDYVVYVYNKNDGTDYVYHYETFEEMITGLDKVSVILDKCVQIFRNRYPQWVEEPSTIADIEETLIQSRYEIFNHCN